MFLLTVASIIMSLQIVEGGYDYPRSGARLELPNHKHGPGVQSFAGGILNEYKNLDENKISYSLPYREHNFLQQHGNGENPNYFTNSFSTSPYQHENFKSYRDFTGFHPTLSRPNTNIGTSVTIQSSDPKRFIVNRPNTVYGSPKIAQSQTLSQHQLPIEGYLHSSGLQEFNLNNVQQTLRGFESNFMNAYPNVASHLDLQNGLPTNVNVGPQLGVHLKKHPVLFNPQSIPNVLETHDQNIQPIAPVFNLQNDFSTQKPYTPQVNVDINPSLNNLNNVAPPIGGQNSLPPVITKHIYFHAPPPDIEEPSVQPTPPKKSYKIIFIKVPSQESKNIETLQAAYNKLGAIEDKTLIYVLSNNSKDSSQLVPAYTPSEHEVLFVKYSGNQSIGSDDHLIEQNEGTYHKR